MDARYGNVRVVQKYPSGAGKLPVPRVVYLQDIIRALCFIVHSRLGGVCWLTGGLGRCCLFRMQGHPLDIYISLSFFPDFLLGTQTLRRQAAIMFSFPLSVVFTCSTIGKAVLSALSTCTASASCDRKVLARGNCRSDLLARPCPLQLITFTLHIQLGSHGSRWAGSRRRRASGSVR